MKRPQVLAGALLATLAATAAVSLVPERTETSAAVLPVPRPSAASTRASVAPPAAATAAAPRPPWPEPEAGALAAWSPPPPPPQPPAPAPPPAEASRPRAPAFPYQWIGRLEQDGMVTALLDGPQRSFGARPGDVLDGQWRVDRVGATRLEVTWLPAAEPVALSPR